MSRLLKESKRYGANMKRLHPLVKAHFDNINRKGQIPAVRNDLPAVREEKQFKSLEDWKYTVGDKVMIVKGALKGTVTSIIRTQKETNGFMLEDGPTKEVVIPPNYWLQSESSHVVEYPKVVTSEYFKLVGTIKDETSGESRQIAANDVVFRGKYWDEDYKKMMPYRCIKNKEEYIIPWPRPDKPEDDKFCTEEAVALERTYEPVSIFESDIPSDLNLRDPLAKRKSRFERKQQLLTKKDLKLLQSPAMPYSDTKKAFFSERAEIRSKQITEMSAEVADFIGKRVADHLNKIKDPYMWQYIKKVSGDRKKR